MGIHRGFFQLTCVIFASFAAVAGLIILFVGIGYQAATDNYDPSQETTIKLSDCKLINITFIDNCDWSCDDYGTCPGGTRYIYWVIAKNISGQCGVEYEFENDEKLLKKDTQCGDPTGDTKYRKLDDKYGINDTFTCYSGSCDSTRFEDEWYCIGVNCGWPISNGKSEITAGWIIALVSIPMFIMFFVATYRPIKGFCEGDNICECCCDCCKCPTDYI